MSTIVVLETLGNLGPALDHSGCYLADEVVDKICEYYDTLIGHYLGNDIFEVVNDGLRQILCIILALVCFIRNDDSLLIST